MFDFSSLSPSRKRSKPVRRETEWGVPTPAPASAARPPATKWMRETDETDEVERNRSSSVFSRLFGSNRAVNAPHEILPPLPDGVPNGSLESKLPPVQSQPQPNTRPRTLSAPSSKCRASTSVINPNATPGSQITSPLPSPSPPPNSPRVSFRQAIGQPPVFQRPAPTVGTAASGIVFPRRKDGRDFWAAEDNVLDEEPDAQERLKSQALVTGWLDAGASAGALAQEADRVSVEEERVQAQEADAAPPLPPSRLVLHINTGAHKSPSMPSLVVNLVDSDDDDREDRVPELDPSASSTTGSPSTMTHYTRDSLWSPVIRSPSDSSGMLLPPIAEPGAITAEESDQFSGGPLSLVLNAPPEKKQRHGLGIAGFGSRRLSSKPPARANTAPTPHGLVPPTATATAKPSRRRTTLSALVRRQTVLQPPSEAELARAEEKMVQPTLHTMGSLNAHIMDLEDEEEQRLAELVYFG